MCAIWGFSLSEGSKINSRSLANALATYGEVRGTDSSGWAFATREGKTGMFKSPVPGSQLSMKTMPRKADTVIGHNRFATQGLPKFNENNHPVQSVQKHITLVHNGHISNDMELRFDLKGGQGLADVDTAVIPAVLEEFGVEGTEKIAGYAAVAWLDDRTGNTLHLSRLDHSPVSIARLLDGSIVFASTDEILAKALYRLNLKWIGSYPDTFQILDDGDYLMVTDSQVSMGPKLEWNDDYWMGRYTSNSWRTMANKAISTTAPKGGHYEYVKGPNGVYTSTWVPDVALADDGFFDEDQIWQDYQENAAADNFYALDHDGDYQGFITLPGLVAYLKFQRSTKGPLTEKFEDGWTNAILDVGHIDYTDENPEMVSWVAQMKAPEEYTNQIEGGLDWIQDGLWILQGVMA